MPSCAIRVPDQAIQRPGRQAQCTGGKSTFGGDARIEQPPVVVQSANTAKLQDDLNEALGQSAQAQLLKLKQEGLRSVNGNQYLDETNAR